MNPFQSATEAAAKTPVSDSSRLQPYIVGWIAGTFSFSALMLLDLTVPGALPGYLASALLLLGLATAAVSSVIAPVSIAIRALACFASLAMMFVQFIVWAVIAITTTGLDGTQ